MARPMLAPQRVPGCRRRTATVCGSDGYLQRPQGSRPTRSDVSFMAHHFHAGVPAGTYVLLWMYRAHYKTPPAPGLGCLVFVNHIKKIDRFHSQISFSCF